MDKVKDLAIKFLEIINAYLNFNFKPWQTNEAAESIKVIKFT